MIYSRKSRLNVYSHLALVPGIDDKELDPQFQYRYMSMSNGDRGENGTMQSTQSKEIYKQVL